MASRTTVCSGHGQVDQAGHEVPELVGAQEQKGAPSRAQFDDRGGHREHLLGGQGEQLGARDVWRCPASAGRVLGRRATWSAPRGPPRDQRNVEHVGARCRDGEQTDEAMLRVAVAVLIPESLRSCPPVCSRITRCRGTPRSAGSWHGRLREHQQSPGSVSSGSTSCAVARRPVGLSRRPWPCRP